MPLAKNREQITVSGEAHAHLKAVVRALRRQGIPTNGTMLASQSILAMPIPDGTSSSAKVTPRKAKPQAAVAPNTP